MQNKTNQGAPGIEPGGGASERGRQAEGLPRPGRAERGRE
jgi:hypothetical protein